MGVAPSRRKGTKAEWNSEIAFQEYAAGGQPVHRLSFVLLENICGFLTLQGLLLCSRVRGVAGRRSQRVRSQLGSRAHHSGELQRRGASDQDAMRGPRRLR
jgi:hypothetical protein